MKRLALPLIAVGILAACGGGSDDAAQPADTEAAAGEPAAASPTTAAAPATQPAAPAATGSASGTAAPSLPADVPEALKFAAPLVGGGDIELTTLAGRPVLLWFWAPW